MAATMLKQARAAFSYEITLGSDSYRLDMQWNSRFRYWTMSLFGLDNIPVYEGRKVLVDEIIFGTTVQPGLPDVDMLAAGVPVSPLRIERDDLANSVAVYVV